ncbi:rhomboid family intramembrane serine protease [Amylibacter marinus]|uniref:Rhomboid family intramembrane serine protease n=1 Tax=Amylibacter marinus TaxID=1475483 RepID=A0ABQ5VV21_9RHOB|nr:rhomboid family intramembrane serine protease [Amylibacter marinus]GLQ35009.1 rhomboid family intramembrane serine protease [Amylibacter marinus]
MFDPNANASPFNSVPAVIVVLVVLMAGIEVIFQLGEAGFIGGREAIGWRLEYSRAFGFVGAIFDWMIQNASYPIEHIIRFVTYIFIHTGAIHALFVCVFTLAMGKYVGEICHPLAVLAMFLLSGLFGALAQALFTTGNTLLLGGYPAVYGLIGAFTWLQFVLMRDRGDNGYMAFRLIGFLIVIQLLYMLAFGGNNDLAAELTGFATGFSLAILLEPKAAARWRALLTRIRAR